MRLFNLNEGKNRVRWRVLKVKFQKGNEDYSQLEFSRLKRYSVLHAVCLQKYFYFRNHW